MNRIEKLDNAIVIDIKSIVLTNKMTFSSQSQCKIKCFVQHLVWQRNKFKGENKYSIHIFIAQAFSQYPLVAPTEFDGFEHKTILELRYKLASNASLFVQYSILTFTFLTALRIDVTMNTNIKILKKM